MSDVKNPKFVLKTGSNDKTYFHLTARNGQAILSSQGYADKAGAHKGIESVRTNCGTEARYEVKTAKDGQHYFVLKAANNQVIGTSEMYTTSAACQKGMESVMANGSTEAVDDTTG